MKTGTNFEQASYSAAEMDASTSRLRYPAEEFQQRAFPGAIRSDNPNHIGPRDRERHIVECPNFFFLPILWPEPTQWMTDGAFDRMAKAVLRSALVANKVMFAQIFNRNNWAGHCSDLA